PKLAPHIPQMRTNFAEVLGCELSQVSVKSTTEEKLGFTGQEQGIAAHCVVLLEKIPAPMFRKPVGRVIPL
ncbi:MAG: 2-C-methyl-D-erythritol 2,4-cyclodiphosphate synthase, partial [Oscillospiraceae bacterium]|nr:2-C-methyl-D-erythritol 2,4-cyclodiphosphate synthase [Oscillospiraceae bacterium]